MNKNFHNHRTLILNATYQPLSIASAKRSVALMLSNKINVIKTSNLENGEVELIDLRTLNPIDWDTIYRSVEKTGKLLIVHEDLLTGGVGAEIAAKVSDNLFEDLDGPIKRVAAQDCHVPYNEELEAEVLPQTDQIVEAINNLSEF